MKPLGRKAYGSIPHLPGSRLGPGDYHCHEGHERIAFGGGRDSRGQKHRVIVTEKLDGSNVAVARKGGKILALVRAGYLASDSPRPQHHVFDEWVSIHAWDNLPEGWRVSGEWLYQAHGTIYEPEAPLILFDAFDENNKRIAHDDQRALFQELGMVAAKVIYDGLDGMTVEQALEALGERGFHGAQEEVEGAVWRVETAGVFNFLAKYVRPDKVDGKYLDRDDDQEPIFMCDPLRS